MGLLNAFSNWRADRYEKHRSTMESLGKCPDCSGRGFIPAFTAYTAPIDCPGCNGSGLYSDWSPTIE
ncbi:methionine aminopeptidase [Bacillus sp. FJAT-49736]|uniref:methionine aminopeptidase n=1 Tax=Bacillus sp. FJAT-49736 TaxID=2833582 RepID=UPI001BC8EC2C|nr:methionine aminopeptidase [Bacillus sp. FJAT-49736]